jgi:hypothetical protein
MVKFETFNMDGESEIILSNLLNEIQDIIDGLTMMLTLGYFSTSLSLKYSLWGASRKIYRKG